MEKKRNPEKSGSPRASRMEAQIQEILKKQKELEKLMSPDDYIEQCSKEQG